MINSIVSFSSRLGLLHSPEVLHHSWGIIWFFIFVISTSSLLTFLCFILTLNKQPTGSEKDWLEWQAYFLDDFLLNMTESSCQLLFHGVFLLCLWGLFRSTLNGAIEFITLDSENVYYLWELRTLHLVSIHKLGLYSSTKQAVILGENQGKPRRFSHEVHFYHIYATLKFIIFFYFWWGGSVTSVASLSIW